MKRSTEQMIHICCVLHEQGDNNARGHVGTNYEQIAGGAVMFEK